MIRNAYRALLKLRFRLKRRGLARFQVMAWVTEGFHVQDGGLAGFPARNHTHNRSALDHADFQQRHKSLKLNFV
jgi:hypothetical protein